MLRVPIPVFAPPRGTKPKAQRCSKRPKALNAPVKWTRASVSKVRTGCITCKIRHLKCDEEKPSCRRCRQDKRVCDGYAQPPSAARTRTCHPETSTCIQQLIAPPLPSLSVVTFHSQTERSLFHYAKECTIKELGRFSPCPGFWAKNVLTLAHSVESIKYALVALGAAHRSFLGQRASDGVVDLRWDYDTIAVQHYNSAIRHVLATSTESCCSSVQTTLVCCLLFVCLENIRGNYAEALRHIQAGSRLLKSQAEPTTMISQSTFSNEVATREVALHKRKDFDDLCDLSDMFVRLAIDSSDFLEDDIILASELTCYNRPLPDEETNRSFASLQSARRILDQIEVDHNILWACYPQCTGHACEHADPQHQYEGSGDENDCTEFSPEENAANKAIGDRFVAWKTRFRVFETEVCEEKLCQEELEDLKILSLRRALYDAIFTPEPYSEDEFEREHFEAIVASAESFVELTNHNQQPVFTFDADIIPPLSFVNTWCNDEDLQQRSINVLRKINRKEGLWDSADLAAIYQAALVAKQHAVWNECWGWEGHPTMAIRLSRLGLLRLEDLSSVFQLATSDAGWFKPRYLCPK